MNSLFQLNRKHKKRNSRTAATDVDFWRSGAGFGIPVGAATCSHEPLRYIVGKQGDDVAVLGLLSIFSLGSVAVLRRFFMP